MMAVGIKRDGEGGERSRMERVTDEVHAS